MAAGLTTASPAAAGGIGDFLSPAFGTLCGNLNNGAHANGTATSATGAAGGNLAGIPIGSPLNQCGGADLNTNIIRDVCPTLQDIDILTVEVLDEDRTFRCNQIRK
ncbi:chaplin family protein [Streptomyces sp. NPDC049837]|uniref:chaplin family protein n=1 Tax=Streptomyces sp. NPDC049837 TaxID=3155277 RepID=UPI0034432B20